MVYVALGHASDEGTRFKLDRPLKMRRLPDVLELLPLCQAGGGLCKSEDPRPGAKAKRKQMPKTMQVQIAPVTWDGLDRGVLAPHSVSHITLTAQVPAKRRKKADSKAAAKKAAQEGEAVPLEDQEVLQEYTLEELLEELMGEGAGDLHDEGDDDAGIEVPEDIKRHEDNVLDEDGMYEEPAGAERDEAIAEEEDIFDAPCIEPDVPPPQLVPANSTAVRDVRQRVRDDVKTALGKVVTALEMTKASNLKQAALSPKERSLSLIRLGDVIRFAYWTDPVHHMARLLPYDSKNANVKGFVPFRHQPVDCKEAAVLLKVVPVDFAQLKHDRERLPDWVPTLKLYEETQLYPGPLHSDMVLGDRPCVLCRAVYDCAKATKLIVDPGDGLYACKSCLTVWHLGCAGFAWKSWSGATRKDNPQQFLCAVCYEGKQ